MKPAILILCIPLLGSAAPMRVEVPKKEMVKVAVVRYVYVPDKYRQYLEYECSSHDVPIWIVANLIARESKWNPKAVGVNRDGTKDLGLMQLNSAFIKEFSYRYRNGLPFDPLKWPDNVAIGVEHLSVLYRHTGSWNGALVAYNAGLRRYQIGKAPQDSIDYAEWILGR